MNTRLLEQEFLYDGSQLRSGWIAEVTAGSSGTAGFSLLPGSAGVSPATPLTGDAAVAFLGPCEVSPEHMVDTVDLEAGACISSPNMVHVIIEHPGLDLHHITTRQRLFMAIAAELINTHLGETLVRREGDDLYLRDRKLSVSVATVSLPGSAGVSPASGPPGTAGFSLPTSGLIHAGFNVRGEGAPVPAIGLEELGLAPRSFAGHLLSAYAEEIDGITKAAAKVKPVL